MIDNPCTLIHANKIQKRQKILKINSSCPQLEKFQKTNSKFQFVSIFHDI